MLFLVKWSPEFSSSALSEAKAALALSLLRVVSCRFGCTAHLWYCRLLYGRSPHMQCVRTLYKYLYFSYFSFAEIAHGYVGADLAAVCKEAGLMSFKRCLAEHEGLSSLDDRAREETLKERLLVTREDIMAAFRQVRPSAMREVAIDVPKVSLYTFISCKRLSITSWICFGELFIFSTNFVRKLVLETFVFGHSS